jgi:hypothetical protein
MAKKAASIGASKKVMVSIEELSGLIEKRAFEIFLERGAGHGNHDGDWYAAEREVKAKYSVKK